MFCRAVLERGAVLGTCCPCGIQDGGFMESGVAWFCLENQRGTTGFKGSAVELGAE